MQAFAYLNLACLSSCSCDISGGGLCRNVQAAVIRVDAAECGVLHAGMRTTRRTAGDKYAFNFTQIVADLQNPNSVQRSYLNKEFSFKRNASLPPLDTAYSFRFGRRQPNTE